MKYRILCLVFLGLLLIGCGGGGSNDDDTGDTGGGNGDVADNIDPNGDLDGDGVSNVDDPDNDNDGIEDVIDPSPDVSADQQDTDGDGITDNADPDADIDGDGIPNTDDPDADGDGQTDAEELDDLLAGTYNVTSTVTQSNCEEENVGDSDTDVMTLGLSGDGESLTATILGDDIDSGQIDLSGWILGNDFTLTGTQTEDPGSTAEDPDQAPPSIDGDCEVQFTVTISGSVEDDRLTGTQTTGMSVTPADCIPDFGCQATSTFNAVIQE